MQNASLPTTSDIVKYSCWSVSAHHVNTAFATKVEQAFLPVVSCIPSLIVYVITQSVYPLTCYLRLAERCGRGNAARQLNRCYHINGSAK